MPSVKCGFEDHDGQPGGIQLAQRGPRLPSGRVFVPEWGKWLSDALPTARGVGRVSQRAEPLNQLPYIRERRALRALAFRACDRPRQVLLKANEEVPIVLPVVGDMPLQLGDDLAARGVSSRTTAERSRRVLEVEKKPILETWPRNDHLNPWSTPEFPQFLHFREKPLELDFAFVVVDHAPVLVFGCSLLDGSGKPPCYPGQPLVEGRRDAHSSQMEGSLHVGKVARFCAVSLTEHEDGRATMSPRGRSVPSMSAGPGGHSR